MIKGHIPNTSTIQHFSECWHTDIRQTHAKLYDINAGKVKFFFLLEKIISWYSHERFDVGLWDECSTLQV